MVAAKNASSNNASLGELRGNLTVHTVPQWQGNPPSFQSPQAAISLAAVQETDSAGLALLVHWANLARAAGVRLKFTDAPAQLSELAKINGLQELFAKS